MGTPWLTQRGFKEAEMVQLADIIADILLAVTPYTIETRKGPADRAKIDFKVYEEAKLKVRKMAEQAGMVEETQKHGYPHFFYIDDLPASKSDVITLKLTGKNIRTFLNYVFSSNVEALKPGEGQPSSLVVNGKIVSGDLKSITPYQYLLNIGKKDFGITATWLRDLSDGFAGFDQDYRKRLPGPILVEEVEP